MNFHVRVPAPPLSDHVALLWISGPRDTAHPRDVILPTATAEIVFALDDTPMPVWSGGSPAREQSFRDAVVCGPHSSHFVIDNPDRASFVGIHFRAGGAAPFFAAPVDELRDGHVALADIWGAAAGEVHERLLQASTPGQRFDVLERFLLHRVSGRLERHAAVRAALRAFGEGSGAPSVATVVERVGLSHRAFAARFRAEVGLTPKVYCRVRRFQEVVRLVNSDPSPDWSRVALGCGYYDQAHFIHDFRAFSGFTPGEYAARRGSQPNHVPLAD